MYEIENLVFTYSLPEKPIKECTTIKPIKKIRMHEKPFVYTNKNKKFISLLRLRVE